MASLPHQRVYEIIEHVGDISIRRFDLCLGGLKPQRDGSLNKEIE